MTQFNMPTIDPAVNNGTQLSSWLNSWQDALESTHSGAARPTYVKSGMIWLKTVSATLWELYLYDGVNDIKLLTMNPSTNVVTVPGFAPMTETGWGIPDASPTSLRTATDANLITVTGLWKLSAGPTNNGPTTSSYHVIHMLFDTSKCQLAFVAGAVTSQMYTRTNASGAWGAWVPVLYDTNWNALTLVNGYGLGAEPLQYRRRNGVTYVIGQVTNAALTSNTVITTLPAASRPDKDLTFVAEAYGAGNAQRQPYTITVSKTTGEVKLLWATGDATGGTAPTGPFTLSMNISAPVLP